MYIRCPKCGRRGHLPDRWVPEARSLRCRKCQAMFKAPETATLAADNGQGAEPAFDAYDVPAPLPSESSFLADGYFSAFEDEPVLPRPAGPGDSSYELTLSLREDDLDPRWDGASDELPIDPPSTDEIPALAPDPEADPGPAWHLRFLERGGPVLIVAALSLIGIALLAIGYLLWRTNASGASLESQAPTLIAGLACTVALLMPTIPMILIAASLAESSRAARLHAPAPQPRAAEPLRRQRTSAIRN